MDSEQRNFERTLAANRATQEQERQEFVALLAKQETALAQQQELYEFAAGKLMPANDPISTTCAVAANEFAVHIGDATLTTDTFPFIVLKVAGSNVISLDRSEDGAIAVSVNLRTADNRLIARIDRNQSVVNPATGLLIRRDKHSLILEDQFEHELLNVRYDNRQSLHISGTVPYHDRAIALSLPYIGCIHSYGGQTGVNVK